MGLHLFESLIFLQCTALQAEEYLPVILRIGFDWLIDFSTDVSVNNLIFGLILNVNAFVNFPISKWQIILVRGSSMSK